jgi:hypothetical protein
MKLLLDVEDSEAIAVLQLLKKLPHVKVNPITDEKALLMTEIREAVENLKLVRAGKGQAQSAKDLLNEI